MRRLRVRLLTCKKYPCFLVRIPAHIAVQSILGARVMTDYEKYLGLPMAVGKSMANTFKDLQVKISKRVIGWKEKFISKTSQEILIKTVAQVILTYSMSLFKLPKTMCDTINSSLAKDWWGKIKDENKIH